MTIEDRPQPGEGWEAGPDGVPYRRAARVILFDRDERVLLARGHDADQPDRMWWFTVGGGIDPGESPREAAVREVREETGILLDPEALTGPVATRSAEFDFYARTVRQDEVFFTACLDAAPPDGALVTDGWTDVERQFMDEVRWWSIPHLAAISIEVFPAELGSLIARLRPWDGQIVHLGHAREGIALGPPAV